MVGVWLDLDGRVQLFLAEQGCVDSLTRQHQVTQALDDAFLCLNVV